MWTAVRVVRRLHGGFLVLLISANVILALVALRSIVTGEPQQYENQHLRLLAGSLTGVAVVTGLLTQWKVGYERVHPLTPYILAVALGLVAWSMFLWIG